MAIPQDQLDHFKSAILSAKRPLFFYDDDADGLCSYLLCYRARGDGIGVRVHGSAAVTLDHVRKVEENLPDLIVVLDKPYIEQAFLDAVSVPVLWLDHHEPQKPVGKQVTYLNPRIADDADNKSTTYWAYTALGRKEDLWIAAIGNISDWQVTEVAEQFWTEYPALLSPVKEAPEALFGKYPFGELCRIVQFNLKGDSADIRTAIKILSRVETPQELLEHTTPRAKLLYKRYQPVEKEYEKYLHAARKSAGPASLMFHEYSTMDISLLSELSNQLCFEYPDKIIFLARMSNGEHKLSIRGPNHDIASAVKIALVESGARGNAGGHTHACGGNIKSEDFSQFLEAFTKAVRTA